MKISKIATLLMIVGFATISQAVQHKQAGIKSLLSNAGARGEPEEVGVSLECAGKGPCRVENPSCECDLESEGPQGTVSVSVGSSESYNCNDSAFTTFNFPTIDDYQRSGLGDQDDYTPQRPRRCRQQPIQPAEPTPYVASRPRSEQCKENVRRPIGATKP